MKKGLILSLLLLPLFAVAADKVPYVATLASTNFSVVYPTPDKNAPGCDFSDTAEPWNGLRWGKIAIEAVGHSTLMGLVTDVQWHCTPLPPGDFGPPPTGIPVPFKHGKATITAANGDTIYGDYEGFATFDGTGLVIDGDLTTTGGTGRFAGANGIGKAFGVQTPTSAAMSLTGTMTPPGAAKKNP